MSGQFAGAHNTTHTSPPAFHRAPLCPTKLCLRLACLSGLSVCLSVCTVGLCRLSALSACARTYNNNTCKTWLVYNLHASSP
jgi:hypothetical protein